MTVHALSPLAQSESRTSPMEPGENMIWTDWRRERDSNPRYGVNPYNALAGRPLRPLGHLSALKARSYSTSKCLVLLLCGLIEAERLVQRPHGELHVFFVDDDRDLDLRCGDHLDV